MVGAIWGIKKHYIVILTWQANVIFLTSFLLPIRRFYLSIISLKDLRFYQPSNDSKVFTQFIKFSIGTTSILIGINLWFAPQISEHWP